MSSCTTRATRSIVRWTVGLALFLPVSWAVAGEPAGPLDLNGDGVMDYIAAVEKRFLIGKSRLQATDGATNAVLWESPCYSGGWNYIWPRTMDTNGDGSKELVFISNGCGGAVALDAASGRTLWTVELKGIDDYENEDLIVVDGIVLAATRPLGDDKRGVLAIDPKNGAVRWRLVLPLQEFSAFDVERVDRDGAKEAGIVPPKYARTVKEPYIDHLGKWASHQETTFFAATDLGRGGMFLADGGRLYHAGRDAIRSVDLATGRLMWTTTLAARASRTYGAVLLAEGDTLLVVDWVGSVINNPPKTVHVAALKAADGATVWERSLDGFFLKDFGATLRLGENVTLEYWQKGQPSKRRVVLDRSTGAVLSDAETAR